jgi:cAMP-dependent protein kinase regulator
MLGDLLPPGGGIGALSSEELAVASGKSDLSDASAPDIEALEEELAEDEAKAAAFARDVSGDVIDDKEVERLRLIAEKRIGNRGSVAGQSWAPPVGWTPPRHEKTFEQHEQIMSACAQSFLFSTLAPPVMAQVVDAFEGPKTIAAGTRVITEGDNVSAEEPAFFIVDSGELSVYKSKAGFAKPGVKISSYTRMGQTFGELALLYNCPRQATIIASSECVLWSLDANTFNNCVKGAALAMRARFNKLLASMDILQGLRPDDRDKIGDVLTMRTYAKDECIIRKGDAGTEFFMLEEGKAHASLNGQRVREYGPLSYFGELALTECKPRSADVFADSTPTTVAVLDGESFKRLLGSLKEVLAERAKTYTRSQGGLPPVMSQPQVEANPRIEDEEVSEGGMDEEEFMRQCGIHEKKHAAGIARTGVAAETVTTHDEWIPPVYPKSANQVKDIKEALLKSFVFASLAPSNLHQIIDACKGPTKVKKGVAVIKEGDAVHGHEPALFILDKGKLNVHKQGLAKKPPGECLLTVDKPGWTFGEVALLYHCPRTATVMTAADSTLWSIDRETFNNCVVVASRKRREKVREFLDSVDILRTLTAECRSKLAEIMQLRCYEPGESIIRQGDEGKEFYIIEEGSAYADKDGARVKEYVAGEYFGELALVHRQKRVASVIANTSPTACLSLDADSFQRLLGNLTDIMEKHEKEYEANLPSDANHEEMYDDVEIRWSPEVEAEFEREGEMSRRRGRRGAILSESFVARADFEPPIHDKTFAQQDQIRNTCVKSFMFSSLDAATLNQVIDAFKGPMRFQRGAEIIRQGDIVHGGEPALYILESGKLDIFRHKPGEPPPGELLTVLETPGRAFGEISLVYNCPRTATVIARTNCALWSIDRDTFNYLVKGAQIENNKRNERFLTSVEILRSISREEIHKLLEVLDTRSYSRGQVIIKKGDLSNEFYMLIEGTAFAILNGQRVREYGSHSYFGELALMYRQPRAADVVAGTTPTVCAVLDAGSFKRILGNLQHLLVERSQNYSTKQVGGAADWLLGKQAQGEEWNCCAKSCGFRNFPRAKACFKCGQPRASEADLPKQSNAIVPFQPQQIVLASQPQKRPPLFGLIPVAVYGVEISGALEDEVSVLYAAYPRRTTDVGIIQGSFPLVPGERFQVSILSLGTFCEVSVGLAPSAAVADKGKQGNKSDRYLGNQAHPRDAQSRGTSMVGWGTREMGFTGDHGRWYFRGRLPGPIVSPPWESGDVLECGMSEGGTIYMHRNGECVAREEGYWPAEDAYPTVTLHSGGTEILFDLRNISRKRPHRATHEQTPTDIAKNLLNGLRHTVLNSGGQNSRSLWSCCTDLQVRRPETLGNSRFGSSGNVSGR